MYQFFLCIYLNVLLLNKYIVYFRNTNNDQYIYYFFLISIFVNCTYKRKKKTNKQRNLYYLHINNIVYL